MADYKTVECDVLIVGGGAAGCGAAIKARDIAERVVLVEKGQVGRSGCSPFAAGIWTIKFPEDDKELWMKEIIESGEYLNDQEWVNTLLEGIHPLSVELDQWGRDYGKIIFEKDDKGNFIRRKSRGHLNTSHCLINAIPMMDTMKRKAREKKAEFIERTLITDLVTSGDRIVGAIGFNYRTGDIYLFKSKAVVSAVGKYSIGKYFLSHKSMSSEAYVAAYRAGAKMFNFEMTISNTCARDYSIHGLNLIVGSGGRFLNGKDQEFMWDYDPDLGNRAGLKTLAIAFCNEVKDGRGPIFLDMSQVNTADQQLMRKILPHSFKTWDRADINLFKDRIPWVPSFGSGGGIRTNTRGESSLVGLYAAGDASSVPQHGTYGIGGWMITYAYVSGCIAGENAARYSSGINNPGWEKANLKEQINEATKRFVAIMDRPKGPRPDAVIRKIQEIMVPWKVGYIRNEERLKNALIEIEQIRDGEIPAIKAIDLHDLVKAREASNLGLLSELILKAALFRKESRGYHFREDYPYTDNRNWLKWVMVQKEDGAPNIWAEDVPTPYLQPNEPISVPPGVKKTTGGT